MSPAGRRFAVIGAGWAGLAAAVDLARGGHAVSVYEAAAEPGGRARGLSLGGHALDNGQHLLIGAYRATLAAIRAVGVAPDTVLERRPLTLRLDGDGRALELRVPRRGGRAALAWALLRLRGIRPAERVRALACMPALRRVPDVDGPADEWLAASGQPRTLIDDLWSPLCLAALNAPPADASARLLARVLREAFADRAAGDLLLPRTDLGGVYPRPAVDWLRRRGHTVRLGHRVRRLARTGSRWMVDDDVTGFDAVVLAAGPAATARLVSAEPAAGPAAARLLELGCAPIATVYLECATGGSLPEPMLGRLDGPAQWLFDRATAGAPGLVAGVISGRGPHETMSREALGRAVASQVQAALGSSEPPRVVGVVREKRATFDPRPGIDALRPGPAGPLAGLWQAGDHVGHGLPATLEGAIRSGQACAAAIDQEETPP